MNHELMVRQIENALGYQLRVGNPLPGGLGNCVRGALNELNDASRAIDASRMDYFAKIEARRILDERLLAALRNL